MSKNYSVDVIIPTYKPDNKFKHLMKRLLKQTWAPNRIYIINTIPCQDEDKLDEAEKEQEELFAKYQAMEKVSVLHITESEFDHGGTRNFGASLSDSDLVLFMTQDAIPHDEYLIENLVKAFDDSKVGAAYARQLARANAGIIEEYTRRFNYPEESYVKSSKDLKDLGIKTYFCSNVCAMYRKDTYIELNGFVTKTIFNEDMIMAATMIDAGYSIAYVAEAKVIHSHSYTYIQQFTRNFDLAVSHVQYNEIFGQVKSEDEGIKLVKRTINYLIQKKKYYLIPDLVMESGFKYLGYLAGSHYKKLPQDLVIKFSMNKRYWDKA